MRRLYLLLCLPLALILLAGCEGDQLFMGSQWDVGGNHISFSHAVAEFDGYQTIELKFNRLSGSSWPNAQVTVEDLIHLSITQGEATVRINLSPTVSFISQPSDTEANAYVTFTWLDLSTYGSVSGTIEGMARSVEHPGDAPVLLQASFTDVPIKNSITN